MNHPGRRFFIGTGMLALCASVAGSLAAAVRFFVPNVLYEPSRVFRVGAPNRFAPGSVTFLARERVYVFRDSAGIYAISAVCSHLGCNVRSGGAGLGFECPCHGSVFGADGQVVGGPAPRPLTWLLVSRDARGGLVIDATKPVEPGFRLGV